ncbi:MAG: hypothetical protein M1814_000255 [Vezdaea aestivalis]|nr:MAG: hypothetical protein M1814_000255 [Vezdaea aestivalis]
MAPAAIGPTPAQIIYQLEHAHENRGPEIEIATGIVLALAGVSVALRFWARHMKGAKLWWDDFMIVLAWAMCAAVSAVVIWAVKEGAGRHAAVVGTKSIKTFLLAQWIFEIIYPFMIGTVKIAILVFYLRIFSVRKFKNIAWGLIIFVLLWILAGILLVTLQCMPLNHFWERINPKHQGECIDALPGIITLTATNVASDFAILLLPIPFVWKLKVTLREKVIISSIFLLGLFVCVGSVIRLSHIFELSSPADPTYQTTNVAIWSVVEPCIAVVCANMMIMRPLWIKYIYNPIRKCTSSRRAVASTESSDSDEKDDGSTTKRNPSDARIPLSYECNRCGNTMTPSGSAVSTTAVPPKGAESSWISDSQTRTGTVVSQKSDPDSLKKSKKKPSSKGWRHYIPAAEAKSLFSTQGGTVVDSHVEPEVVRSQSAGENATQVPDGGIQVQSDVRWESKAAPHAL